MDNKEFPLKTQIWTFENESYIDKWLTSQDNSGIYGIDYALKAHAPYLYTDSIQDSLARYSFQKKGYISYSNLYDDLPALWVETVSLIDSELEKAMEKKRNERN